jgi:hypothetical protein
VVVKGSMELTWERLKELAQEINNGGRSISGNQARTIVETTLRECHFESVPEEARDYLVSEFMGFVERGLGSDTYVDGDAT